MQTLVMQKIIRAEAAECGTPCIVKPAAVTKELKGIITTEFKDSRKDFDAFLKERKLTNDDAREIVLNSLLQQRLYDNVTRGVRFSTDDAKTYYDEHKDQFSTPAAARPATSWWPRGEAEAIRAVSPRRTSPRWPGKSTDPRSATQGGDLGHHPEGTAGPRVREGRVLMKTARSRAGRDPVRLAPHHGAPGAASRRRSPRRAGHHLLALEQKPRRPTTRGRRRISGGRSARTYASETLSRTTRPRRRAPRGTRALITAVRSPARPRRGPRACGRGGAVPRGR